MTKRIEKFLEFNGKQITAIFEDDSWWVPIKPVCAALNVNYERQFQNIKDDEILSKSLSKHTNVAADEKRRKMLCMPEKFVYGWILSIQSESQELLMCKRKCYIVLYDFFRGSATPNFT